MNKLFILVLMLTSNIAFSQTSTQKLEEVKEEKSKFGISFLSEIYAKIGDLSDGDTDNVSSYNAITPEYKITENDTISYGFVFETKRSQYSESGVSDVLNLKAETKEPTRHDMPNVQRFGMGEHYIKYSRSNLNLLGVSSGSARLYLPTSDSTELIGKYKLRMDWSVPYELTKSLTLKYSFSPRYSLYSKDSVGQPTLEARVYTKLIQKLNDKANVVYSAMLKNTFYNTGEQFKRGELNVDGSHADPSYESNDDNTSNKLYLNVSTDYAINDNFSIEGYIEQSANLEAVEDFSLLEKTDTVLGLVLSASL